MNTSIVISLIVSGIVLIAATLMARWFLKRINQSTDERAVRPSRLTSEHLHRLPPPTWRVVHEIDHPDLPDIDQVAIGPAGILAISTVLGDRPLLNHAAVDTPGGAQATAAAAIMRAPVDELVSSNGLRCHQLAHVYWGTEAPDQPASLPIVHAAVAVDGRRLDDWITSLPTNVLTPSQVDIAWHAVATGIGRPDPLRP